jgi:hypothetical protein
MVCESEIRLRMLMGELECWRGEGLRLKGRRPWPPSASGSEQTFLTSRWGEESMKDWSDSWETNCKDPRVRM